MPKVKKKPAKKNKPKVKKTESKLRTTELEYEQNDPISIEGMPLYKNGCPKCKKKFLVTVARTDIYRFVRCRECEWTGRLRI